MFPIYILTLVFWVVTLIGIVWLYFFPDWSKYQAWFGLNRSSSQFHVLFGAMIGLLVLPVRYPWERERYLEDPDNKSYPPEMIIRQMLGVGGFLYMSIRNYKKHTENFGNALREMGKNQDKYYATFRSSSTRQQLQLALGIMIASIAMLVFNRGDGKIDTLMVVPYLCIVIVLMLQVVVQAVMHHDNTDEDFRKIYIAEQKNKGAKLKKAPPTTPKPLSTPKGLTDRFRSR